jgi:hypothetical protein
VREKSSKFKAQINIKWASIQTSTFSQEKMGYAFLFGLAER